MHINLVILNPLLKCSNRSSLTMKIAVPTHDGLMIAPLYEHSSGFLVFTVELGEIMQEELRWNNDMPDQSKPLYYQIADCTHVIVNNIGEPSCTSLLNHGITCLKTGEKIITNAAFRFLSEEIRKASDTYCCP